MVFKSYSGNNFVRQASKGNNSKGINARVNARLLLIDIHMKFREDILKGFHVIERTRFCDGQTSKGNNSKSINAKIMVV